MENCNTCKKPCGDEDRYIKCDLCEKNFHIKCDKVSVDLYNALSDPLNGGVCWFCKKCRDAAVPLHRQMAQLRLDQSEIKKQIVTIEKEKVNKSDLEEEVIKNMGGAQAAAKVKEIVSSQIQEAIPKETIRGLIREELHESEDIENRKNNIILHGIDEGGNQEQEAAKRKDKSSVEEIFKLIDPSFVLNRITDCRRLGKKVENKNRPLLLKMDSGDHKEAIMRNLVKLKDSPWHKTVSVSHDMTSNQRDTRKGLIQKAKEEAGDERDRFLFKIVGRPGREKVIKKKKEEDPTQREPAEADPIEEQPATS